MSEPEKMKLKARAYYEHGIPKLEIPYEEMEYLNRLLKEKLGREPTTGELFQYVLRENAH